MIRKTNTKYLIGSSSSTFRTNGISRFSNFFSFSRDLVTFGDGCSSLSSPALTILLFFSARLSKPFVVGNWAASEISIGTSFSVETTKSPFGMVEWLDEGIVSSSSSVRRRVASTPGSVD